jgi:hypothetical protein
MKRKTQWFVSLLALLALVPVLSGDDRDNKKISELMRRKLTYAQRVLEGVALNDFDRITRNAEELIQVSKDVEWQVVKTPRYEVHSNEFRRAVETMIEKSRDKNLDGAALAYVEMTLTCVKCHKYVREVKMTRLPVEESTLFSALRKGAGTP